MKLDEYKNPTVQIYNVFFVLMSAVISEIGNLNELNGMFNCVCISCPLSELCGSNNHLSLCCAESSLVVPMVMDERDFTLVR